MTINISNIFSWIYRKNLSEVHASFTHILCEHIYIYWLVAGVGEENPPGRDLTQVHPITACWHAGHCWAYYSQRKYYWVDISSAVLNKHVHIMGGEYLEARCLWTFAETENQNIITICLELAHFNAYGSFNACYPRYQTPKRVIYRF